MKTVLILILFGCQLQNKKYELNRFWYPKYDVTIQKNGDIYDCYEYAWHRNMGMIAYKPRYFIKETMKQIEFEGDFIKIINEKFPSASDTLLQMQVKLILKENEVH